jgi:hypothetical protein
VYIIYEDYKRIVGCIFISFLCFKKQAHQSIYPGAATVQMCQYEQQKRCTSYVHYCVLPLTSLLDREAPAHQVSAVSFPRIP